MPAEITLRSLPSLSSTTTVYFYDRMAPTSKTWDQLVHERTPDPELDKRLLNTREYTGVRFVTMDDDHQSLWPKVTRRITTYDNGDVISDEACGEGVLPSVLFRPLPGVSRPYDNKIMKTITKFYGADPVVKEEPKEEINEDNKLVSSWYLRHGEEFRGLV